jgi:hypothetical protein
MARHFKLPAALCAAGFLCAALPAQAGLFDDDVAGTDGPLHHGVNQPFFLTIIKFCRR